MKMNPLLRFVIYIAIIVMLFSFASCDTQDSSIEESGSGQSALRDADKANLPQVEIVTLEQSDLEQEAQYLGVIRPQKSVDLSSASRGSVARIHVTEGDRVNKGDKLISLDLSELNNETIVSRNNLLTTLGNLNQTYSLTRSHTNAGISRARVSIEIARTELSLADLTLQNTTKTAANDVNTAELNISNAKTSSVLDVDLAESQLGSAKTALKNVDQETAKQLSDIREDARVAQIDIYNDLVEYLDSINNILGQESINMTVNDSFEKYLGIMNQQSRFDSLNAYNDAKVSFDKLDHKRSNPDLDLEELLLANLDTAQVMSSLIDYVDVLLKYTLSNLLDFPPSELASLKSTVNALQEKIQGTVSRIQDTIQGIKDAKLAVENRVESAQKSVDSATKSLQKAKQKLSKGDEEISILNARRALANVKVQAKQKVDSSASQFRTAKEKLKNAELQLRGELESQKLQLQNIAKQIDDLEGQLAMNQISLEDQIIRAPFDGVILSKNVEIGAEISVGAKLMSIGDLDSVIITIRVADDELIRFSLGSVVQINQSLTGKVSKILPQADPQSRKFDVEILAQNAKGLLQSGSLVEILINYTPLRNALFVPLNSVAIRQDGNSVYLLKDSIARLQLIETGRLFGDVIEVKKGLKVGDRVIVDGLKFVKDEGEVKIREE